MLILSRKDGEAVFVGDDVEVVVIEARNGRVSLGFRAPKDKRIERRPPSQPVKKRGGSDGREDQADRGDQ